MIKYPILYGKQETIFNSFGIAILQNAWDIVITQTLNQEYTLKFNAPLDQKLKDIINDAFWVRCNDKIFYIIKITQKKDFGETISCEFECEHVSFYIRNSYINNVAYAGDSTKTIISNLINGFLPNNSRFIPATWMKNDDIRTIDFRNKNIMEAFDDYCEKYGGEIDCSDLPNAQGKFEIGIRLAEYNDNYEYIGGGKGSFKLNIQIRDRKNIVSLKKEIDTTQLVDKLFVFGKTGGSFEGTTIIYDKDGVSLQPSQFINIPENVQSFPISFVPTADSRVGYVQFNDVDTKQELYWAGKAKFDQINKPRTNYQVSIVDLRFLEDFRGFDNFEVGDVINFVDKELTNNEKIQLRVTNYKCYPLEPEKNSASFSTITNNIFYTFARFIKSAETTEKMATKNKEAVAGPEKTYVETSEVIVDTVNDPYNGIFVANGRYDGTIYAGDTKTNPTRSGLFFHRKGENVGGFLDGGFFLYSENGVGFICDWDDTVPKIRYPNGTTSDILTKANSIDNLADVVVTSPTPGQALLWDVAQQKWVNASISTQNISNIEINNPQPAEALMYNIAASKWKNTSIMLESSANVEINNPQDGQSLKYNAATGKWVNSF
jgi:hypothetical protein